MSIPLFEKAGEESIPSGRRAGPGIRVWSGVQAFDGVTTALQLEAGMLPTGRWCDLQARSKRIVNYGASSWSKASYLPTKYLEETAPQMKKRVGSRLAWTRTSRFSTQRRCRTAPPNQQPNPTSVGVKYLLVHRASLIRNSELNTKAFPGRPVRRAVSQ